MVGPMSPATDRNRRFSLWLRHEIENGLSVGPDTCAYLNATFGHTDLARILSSAESSDVDTLTDLLFFPDERLRCRFEAQWGEDHFSETDLGVIRMQLIACPPQPLIRTDWSERPLQLTMPAFAAEALLERLKLTWRPCPPFRPILQRMEVDLRVAVRMRLRSARLEWHTGQADLMVLYLTRMPAQTADSIETLTFLISLLAELAADAAPEAFLIDRKRFYFQSWHKAGEFERRRLASNMETLMSQGERAAHGEPQHWREQMARIDRLSLILFNRVEWIADPVNAHREVAPNGSARDLDALMEWLG